VPQDPCQPSPCGPNSECRRVGDTPSCSCLSNFFGTPPNCRPECVSNSECSQLHVCTNNRCRDPCPGLCGTDAVCRVISHSAMCYCQPGYSGDPYVRCEPHIQREPVEIVQPCNPNPCGTFAECRQQNGVGSCQCLPEYFGNPYEGCRPECVLDSDCPSQLACVNQKCRDPCPGSCGQNAECFVRNHLPTCNCLSGYVGDPYRYCNIEPKRKQIPPIPSQNLPLDILNSFTAIREYVNPCQPSPCGPNSQCREQNGVATCSCLPEYVGLPPGCRPECTVSSECNLDKACVRHKCVDPCPGVCGSSADCRVVNHAPLCSCQSGYTGDPFTRCYPIPRKLSKADKVVTCPVLILTLSRLAPPTHILQDVERDPCQPSPCGANAQCRQSQGQAICSCLPNYFGVPPNCRPECTQSSECLSSLACINQRCADPCPGSCAYNAICHVRNHVPSCQCPVGYVGDPFTNCQPEPQPPRKNN